MQYYCLTTADTYNIDCWIVLYVGKFSNLLYRRTFNSSMLLTVEMFQLRKCWFIKAALLRIDIVQKPFLLKY